jgi:hypothetical protein
MADHPILFSALMVRALLAGTKTQTRRGNHLEQLRRFGLITKFGRSDTNGYDWHFRDKGMLWHDLRHAELLDVLPWQTGDRLWVRENILQSSRSMQLPSGEWESYWTNEHFDFCADEPTPKPRYLRPDEYGSPYMAVRPSIHMPRVGSRITLTVTDVRVERLQNISEADAIAEGVFVPEAQYAQQGERAPINAYAGLWEEINGPGAWDANPWVAAYTFTVELGNIDQHRGAT